MSSEDQAFNLSKVTTEDVKNYWQDKPLCVEGNPYELGTPEFFKYYDSEREVIEPISYSYKLHEYLNFKDKKVLDVGCGNGYVLSKYATEGAEVFGIDITDVGVELCSKRFRYMKLNGDFRVADAEDIPFPDDTFDCVCSMGVLHHVPNTQKALDEIFRVLKPGGRLIVMFYHRNSAKYQFKFRIWSLITGKPMQQLVNEFDGLGNPKGTVFTRKELGKILSNFTSIRMNVGFLETRDIILRGARFLPDKLFLIFAPLIGWNLYAKARKPL